MGAGRIGDLPERSLIRAVSDARQTALERKGIAQRVSGANLAYFTSESTLERDWAGRLDAVTDYGEGYVNFLITLTAEAAVVPLVDLAATVYRSADGVNWIEYPQEQALFDRLNGISPMISMFLGELQGAQNEPHQVTYSLSLYGSFNARAAFKVQVFGTDVVTMTIVRTA